jgi:hypothetical protein
MREDMSEEEAQEKSQNPLLSPQVLAALITGVVAIALALIPALTANPQPTPTATFTPTIAPAATAVPATEAISLEPTSTSTFTPAPTLLPPATESPTANVLLLYDDVAFTISNQGSRTLSLANLRFRRSNGNWNASQWGVGLVDGFRADNCLRMRDTTASQRQPPSICGTLLGLQLVSGTALFWFDVDTFEVLNNDTVIAVCSTVDDTCPIYVEPE